MRVLITGGCGFIGSHLANALIKDHEVIVLDDLSRGKIIPDGATFIKCDLIEDDLDSHFQGVDAVIHLASRVGSMGYYRDFEYNVLSDNTSIDKNVIETSRRSGVRYFINASSAHVYGLSNDAIFEDEAWTKRPPITYGTAKLLSEELVRSSGMLNASLRFVGIYGPGQDSDLSRGSLIPVLCKKALDHPKTEYGVLTNGEESRTYCFIEDAIEATLKTLDQLRSANKSLPPMNIGSSKLHTVYEIASEVLKAAGKDLRIHTTEEIANIKTQSCDYSLAKSIINWEAKTGLPEGLRKTYNWFRSSI
mgnify:CR=1 FL=1|tara:strand:+ start:4587 stop:5504 length:918 start_codon:yes stop_codon:yes gene_type:complete